MGHACVDTGRLSQILFAYSVFVKFVSGLWHRF